MIRNKRGEGYVQVCVLIIVICMILSVFVTFASAVNVVRLTERNTKTVLESYVTKNSIEIYNAIKQGDNTVDNLTSSVFVSDLTEFCTFVKRGSLLYHYGVDGKADYYITTPAIAISNDNKLKLMIQYTLYIPMYFDSVRISTVQVPITVKVDLEERF